MKVYCIILVLFISQVIFNEARTLDDVIKDFQSVYDEIHTKMGNDQNFVHTEGSQKKGDAIMFNSLLASDYRQLEEGAASDIRNTVKNIIGENGMIPYPELIQHCVTKEQQDLQSYLKQSDKNSLLCQRLAAREIDYIVNNTLNIFYLKQSTFHTDLEATKTKCKNTSKTTEEMQECLIHELYFVYKPLTEQLHTEMYNVLNDVDNQFGVYEMYIGDCFQIASDTMVNDRLPIIEEFRVCVVEAANNKPYLYYN